MRSKLYKIVKFSWKACCNQRRTQCLVFVTFSLILATWSQIQFREHCQSTLICEDNPHQILDSGRFENFNMDPLQNVNKDWKLFAGDHFKDFKPKCDAYLQKTLDFHRPVILQCFLNPKNTYLGHTGISVCCIYAIHLMKWNECWHEWQWLKQTSAFKNLYRFVKNPYSLSCPSLGETSELSTEWTKIKTGEDKKKNKPIA